MSAVCKVIDNACSFPLGDCLNLLTDGCFQCSNGVRVVLVDDILEEAPEEEIWGVQIKSLGCPFHFSFASDEMLPKLFMEPSNGDIMEKHHPDGTTVPSHQGFHSLWAHPRTAQALEYNVLLSLSLCYPDHIQRKIVL